MKMNVFEVQQELIDLISKDWKSNHETVLNSIV